MDNEERNVLINMYQCANDQVILYAGFRWKAFSILFTINSGLMYIYFVYTKNFLINLIGILLTFLLFAFERRHRYLFHVSRNTAIEIEKSLMEHLSKIQKKTLNMFVFHKQVHNKKSYTSHHFAVIVVISIILMIWMYLLFFEHILN